MQINIYYFKQVFSKLFIGFFLAMGAFSCTPQPKVNYAIVHRYNLPENPNEDYEIKDGIEVTSGLIAEGDWILVKQTCTVCHSAKLITQNRNNAEGWTKLIKWMQETQGLWPLGGNEAKIVNYLSTNYAPENVGRRKQLEITEWYDIE